MSESVRSQLTGAALNMGLSGDQRLRDVLLNARDCVEALEAALAEAQAKVERLRAEMRRYLPVLEALEANPSAWEWYTDSTGIATLNGYRATLEGAEAVEEDET